MNIKELEVNDIVQLQNGQMKKVVSVHSKGLYHYVKFEDSSFPDIYQGNGEFLHPLENHPLNIIKIVREVRAKKYTCEGGGLVLDYLYSEYNTCLTHFEKEEFIFEEL
jgi:hypothetical protein